MEEARLARRQTGKLVCRRCGKETPTLLIYDNPHMGDGWPLHKCGYEARPFDSFRPDKYPSRSLSL